MEQTIADLLQRNPRAEMWARKLFSRPYWSRSYIVQEITGPVDEMMTQSAPILTGQSVNLREFQFGRLHSKSRAVWCDNRRVDLREFHAAHVALARQSEGVARGKIASNHLINRLADIAARHQEQYAASSAPIPLPCWIFLARQ